MGRRGWAPQQGTTCFWLRTEAVFHGTDLPRAAVTLLPLLHHFVATERGSELKIHAWLVREAVCVAVPQKTLVVLEAAAAEELGAARLSAGQMQEKEKSPFPLREKLKPTFRPVLVWADAELLGRWVLPPPCPLPYVALGSMMQMEPEHWQWLELSKWMPRLNARSCVTRTEKFSRVIPFWN